MSKNTTIDTTKLDAAARSALLAELLGDQDVLKEVTALPAVKEQIAAATAAAVEAGHPRNVAAKLGITVPTVGNLVGFLEARKGWTGATFQVKGKAWACRCQVSEAQLKLNPKAKQEAEELSVAIITLGLDAAMKAGLLK